MASTNAPQIPPDNNRGPGLLAADWLTIGLGIVTNMLRFYMRLKKHAHGWDDYTIYVALAICIAGAAINTQQVHMGFGRHIEHVQSTLSQTSKWTTIAEIQTNLATGFVKISVCLFILRIIKNAYNRLRWVIITFMILMTVGTLVLTFCLCFQCFPLRKAWEPHTPGSCFSPTILAKITKGLGVFICLTDLFCSFIPIMIFKRLQMNKMTKIALCLIMSLGVLTAACSIGQVVTVEYTSKDITWDLVPVETWTLLQENLGVTVASLPTLRPLFAQFLQTMTSRSMREKYQRHNNKDHDSTGRLTVQDPNRQQVSCETIESDGIRLAPSLGINVERTTDVEFTTLSSSNIGAALPWERIKT